LLELHSLQLVESRSVSCSYQRPTWRGTSAAWGILPGRPNTCYTTSQGERYRWHHLCTEDVSGSQQHSEASRRRESPRCRAVHQYRTALWRFRSSRSSSECRRSRARIFRTASHSAPCFGGDLTRNNHQDKFATEHLTTRIQPTVCFVFDISWFPVLPLQ